MLGACLLCTGGPSEEGGVLVQPLPLLGADGVRAPPLCTVHGLYSAVGRHHDTYPDLWSAYTPSGPWQDGVCAYMRRPLYIARLWLRLPVW